jgi:hypothetical protein
MALEAAAKATTERRRLLPIGVSGSHAVAARQTDDLYADICLILAG